MRIVIDGQALQSSSRFRGIGRYAKSLTQALAAQRGDHELILALNGMLPETIEPIRQAFDGLLPRGAIRVWEASAPVEGGDPANGWRRRAAELVRETFLHSLQPDCILVSSVFEGLGEDVVTTIGALAGSVPTAAIFYDLIPHLYADHYLANPVDRSWYEEKLEHVGRADLLLAISEATRQDTIRYLGCEADAVVNISAAADARFAPRSIEVEEAHALYARYGIARSFVMYTGGDDHRKNFAGLVRAYASLPRDLRQRYQLVIVCQLRPEIGERLRLLGASLGIEDRDIVFTGQIPDDDLVALYNLATLFVFPSLYEGFGLPALEAMKCGTAVIASNTSSVREVIGREDALFDPASDDAVREKMETVLRDDGFRRELQQYGRARSAQFSWQASAQRALEALEALCHRPNATLHAPALLTGRKPSMAYLSPLPPQRSGVSGYSSALLPDLARHYDIEVVVAQEDVSDTWVTAHCPIRDADWFLNHAGRYDRILYQMGNSEFHEHMFGLLAEVPGVVVLHDFFLSGVLEKLETDGQQPGIWSESLYRSHGYAALAERLDMQRTGDVAWQYPCNLPILERAIHVVSHSHHARELARQWYGPSADTQWSVVPLVRRRDPDIDKSEARRALGLPPEAFVVCVPGHSGPTKLSQRVFDAWQTSRLAREKNAFLIFAGWSTDTAYQQSLEAAISGAGAADRVRITGWLEAADYRRYLASADVGIQLRTLSRGETSAAALDCMSHGLPTVVNLHGALAELPKNCVVQVPEAFSDAELAAAMDRLWQEEDLRKDLGANAQRFVRAHHAPDRCADALSEAVERGYGGLDGQVVALSRRLGAVAPRPQDRQQFLPLAAAVARTFPPPARVRQLMLDISEFVAIDARSGIQRVVRSLLAELLAKPPAGYRVEPVYASPTKGYRYAREFTLRFLGCPQFGLTDDPLDFAEGDVFLMLDLHHRAIFHRAYLEAMRRHGVSVWAVVYDLLPVRLPDYFPREAKILHGSWLEMVSGLDGAACISRAVALELEDWLAHENGAPDRFPIVEWFHLGSDLEASQPTAGLPDDAETMLGKLASRPTFLMVGTVEPRKGYAQTLAAFEKLWRRGHDVNLVIVGRHGWQVDGLAKRLRRHRERGARLFWLDQASDEYLEKIYAASTCLIAASEGEGFGLPLIEAARHGLPIIARDLPVFEEVAGSHAWYFSGLNASDLAQAVAGWLRRREQGDVPSSAGLLRLSWAESASELLRCVLGKPAREGAGTCPSNSASLQRRSA